MARFPSISASLQVCKTCMNHVSTNLRKTSVWRPVLKNTLGITITMIIGVIPATLPVYGAHPILTLVPIFNTPGRRFGQVAAKLCLTAIGTILGVAWSSLGIYLSSLVPQGRAAWTIRAIFFTLATLFHGWLRSLAPRLFVLVFFFLLAALTLLTSAAGDTQSELPHLIYPVFTAIGVVILVNVTIFPQFSSDFLGTSTIGTLKGTIDMFQEASDWFMSDPTVKGDGYEEETSMKATRKRLSHLTGAKAKLRSRLSSCKEAQAECNFELVLAVLPPRSLKPISVTMMTRLVQVTISLINACESKFALEASAPLGLECEKLVGNGGVSDSQYDDKLTERQRIMDVAKLTREIQSGDIDDLEHIMSQIRHPARAMLGQIRISVRLITSALIYCYDVSNLSSEFPKPEGIALEEMDTQTENFTKALANFDNDSAAALENAAATVHGRRCSIGDTTPRMETHLASSFLVNISQAAVQILEMMKHARILVERRQSRNGRKKLFWPQMTWKKWLASSGDEEDATVPGNVRKEARTGYGPMEDITNQDDESSSTSPDAFARPKTDEETGGPRIKEDVLPRKSKELHRKSPRRTLPANHVLRVRGLAADILESLKRSDDLAYALRMTIAALLITWPAFVQLLHPIYQQERGSWATQQLIIAFEVSIGTAFWAFFLRALGTIAGCSVGILAWKLGNLVQWGPGNRIVYVIALAIRLVPGSYVQKATPYAKTGYLYLVCSCLIVLATVDPVPGNYDGAIIIYTKRLISFLVGGVVALIVEMTIFPVRARHRLVESLASAITQISIMESSVAVGVDSPNTVDIKSHALNAHFKSAKEKAEQALSAAETFLPFSLTEPRIKSHFKGQALVYSEMKDVLFEIIERMDNMLHIRKLYGDSVLEVLHTEMLPYRRNVAGCVTLALFAVQEGLTTRQPLPQFLPSSRVAHLRYVARARELLYADEEGSAAAGNPSKRRSMSRKGSSATATNAVGLKDMTRQNLAWKASSAGMMEIIEYVEELVDLAKLLVGVHACRGGMFEPSMLREYIAKMKTKKRKRGNSECVAARSEKVEERNKRKGHPTGAAATGDSAWDSESSSSSEEDEDEEEDEYDIPWRLRRIMRKRKEESERGLVRLKTEESRRDAKGKSRAS